ncbi:F0F1 ATP synthase subunit gamma [Clostridium sardiniense]|uniref:ATP synthase gamma chain n=1 Tax=Clostridium sardiniense TaxID=29369 RepID=A0ABS7KY49_CLOSR|nr:ATP synthase F1 subunit gamma [Clostridium sardiniense]MBY0755743.1 F0F1 ATP synthase subunit gamma [Clostridium sardiniense]MDQ0460030.1 F-type H+-transporting ATPase subunit gamma [Clostridium sardiniense]
MAGAGLIEIKRRIKSVENTKKITKAMGLVATSKLRRVRMELNKNNSYFEATRDIAQEAYSSMDVEKEGIYFKGGHSKRKLYIVVTSDSGLCGGYNVNIALSLKNHVGMEKSDSLVMCLGKKGVSYMKRYGFETVAEYVDIKEASDMKEVSMIYKHALRLYNSNEVGEIYVVYTHFNSPVSQEVKVDKMLPIEFDEIKEDIGFMLEPNDESSIEATFDFYLKSKLINCILNAKTSEESSRMTAMDGATKNADDLLDSLNTKYNRIRQSAITQEIAEIVGGAEAQK